MKKSTKLKATSITMFIAQSLPESLAYRLSEQSKSWPSLGDIQTRVIRLFGDVVPCPTDSSDSLLLTTLTEMADTWDELHEKDELLAFRQVCINVLKRSQGLLACKVMAKDPSGNPYMMQWDPIERDFTEFISYCKSRTLLVERIVPTQGAEDFTKQASLLFINKLFSRAELKRLGVMPYNSESSTDIGLFDLLMNPEKLLANTQALNQELTYGS
ncbi:hypothetical protein ACRZ5S_23070 (plasmid) [Vibrio scophthalmi]|uniref:hypothetical protein n=1 Tax=Vibrio scophthalmi TaxID=45658 RepID=UPI003EBB4063